ncbi:3D domain-containing protein [Paenibacillus motobuensis]|uniref:3D domain-containing protein n=1 Tax=Paenibacillus motobuensis TaxID=295324 RepID=UPI00362E3F59
MQIGAYSTLTIETGSPGETGNHRFSSESEWITFEATAYTAFCPEGCIGVTRTGVDVSRTIEHEGRRVVAVDPDVIPLGSTLAIRLADGTEFEATAQDTGGAIKGEIIDVLVKSEKEARQFGRQAVEIRIINEEESE